MPQTKNDIPCKVEGCPRIGVVAKGLCATHYQRLRRTGRLDTVYRNHEQSPWCTIDGCDRPLEAKGLCSMHYDRQRNGNTDMRPGPLPTATDMRAYIEARSTLSGGHLLWDGRMRDKLPVTRAGSGRNSDLSVRRIWWELDHDTVDESTFVVNTCGESRCLNHLDVSGYARGSGRVDTVTSR
jgi:hypothetical protein